MSDIQVGDRVRHSGGVTGIVQALYKAWAWVDLQDAKKPMGYQLEDLTRIEPKKVVLTPKYAVGQRMNLLGGVYPIEKVVVAYELNGWFGLRAEDSLKPVPEPCPACKGSGVSEGSA